MNKRLVSILFFGISLLICNVSDAQRTVKIVDSDSGNSLQNASITVYDFNSKLKVFGVSDENGNYTFSKLIGGVYIEVSHAEFVSVKVVGNDTFKHLVIKLVRQNNIISPTIITAEGNPISSNQSANNVRVITRDKIEKMGVNNLSELLMNEVNMNVNQDNVLGSSVIMQGVSGQNIKILLNGVPIIGRVNGNIDISQVNLNNVLRIEIVEGPMSAIYGSDALGGVLNIITKYPDKKSFSATANTYVDNQQNYNLDGMVERAFSKKFRMNISGGRYFFTGVDFNPNTRSVDWKPKEKIFTDVSTVFYTGKVQHRLRNAFFYEKLIDKSDAEYTPYSITGYNSNYFTSRFDNSLNTIININKSSKIELINSFNYYRRLKTTMVRNLVTGAEQLYRNDALDTTSFRLYISRFTLSKSMLSNKVNLLTGYDLNIEDGTGKRLTKVNNTISDIALFGVLDIKPNERLKIRPSIRVIHNSKFGNEILGSKFKLAPIIPSLQVKYDIASFLFLRASVARGFRAPTLKELNFFFVDMNHNITGNPNLKAETSENYNIMLDYRNNYGKGHLVTMSYSMFHNHIKDKINLALEDVSTNRFTYINIGEFRSQGISFNIDYYMQNWQFTFGTSTIGIRDYTGVDSTSSDYSYYSQARFNLSRTFPEIGFQVNLINKYHGETRGYNSDLTTYKTPSYLMSDLTFQKSAFKESANITFGIKNLLNITSVRSGRRATTVHDSSGGDISISPGRTFFIKISYNINKISKKPHQKV